MMQRNPANKIQPAMLIRLSKKGISVACIITKMRLAAHQARSKTVLLKPLFVRSPALKTPRRKAVIKRAKTVPTTSKATGKPWLTASSRGRL
tara:strand:- start:489 stop:764 length:276 start_codon:yes stop_codon:yes gene_type:complete